jgi:iron complex transport system ATP-binding protein
MNESSLSFHSISFGYHKQEPILQNVDFSLHAGKITAILGPNGVGKTTLLSLALGWLTAWTGEIRLADKPLKGYSHRERGRRIALVPQTEHTPFAYTLLQYVLLGRAPHLPPLGMPDSRDVQIAISALEQVGLSDLADRPVPQLSGGERQLMLLARAITQISPSGEETEREFSPLLLLDEPTSHLDLSNKARIIQFLRRLRTQGVSLLMTIHEPDVVLALADDVLLLEHDAPPLFGAMEQILTAEALSRIYSLPIRLVEIDGRKQVLWT